jgi:hypothetical protein
VRVSIKWIMCVRCIHKWGNYPIWGC